MSWQEVNKILSLAILDAQFAERLLTDPIPAIREAGFDLTEEEEQCFREARARDIAELSLIMLNRLKHEEP